jgi:hypothetical protein
MSKRNKPGRIIKLGPYDPCETIGIWRSMDSAPKDDDTPILAYFVFEKEQMIDVVWRYFGEERWGTAWDALVKPTHWMPLPKPPAK